MSAPALELTGVSKSYVKYEDAPMLLSSLRLRSRTTRSVLQAVRDLDLRIDEGESVGVLGRNGAGKSTLLQMLGGVTAPSRGRVQVRGRISPLISVGVGFHAELTGRENVYVNGTVLGMTKSEIDRRFDEILAFAEIEEFIDTPVKFYSSGMFVRLGFAVAVAADPDVLLVDEVLAVGDFAFQTKCFRRMEQIRSQGTTIVVVSHNIAAIRGLCSRGVVLQRGLKIYDGPVHDAVSAYYSSVGQAPIDELDQLAGGTGAVVESFDLVDAQGRPTAHLTTGDEATLRITVRAERDIARPILGVSVAAEAGGAVYSDTNLASPFEPLTAGQRATYDVTIQIGLGRGGYVASAGVHAAGLDGATERLVRAEPLSFYVSGRGMVTGVVDLGGRFQERPA